MLLAPLNVRYRDVGIAMPLIVQIWLFATPVIYPASLVPGGWQYLYSVNPMVSAVDGVRWAFLGTPGPELGEVAISVAGATAAVMAAVLYSEADRALLRGHHLRSVWRATSSFARRESGSATGSVS